MKSSYFNLYTNIPTACQQALPIHLHRWFSTKLTSCRGKQNSFLFLGFYTTRWWLFWDDIMACYLRNIVGVIVLWLTHKVCVVWWVNKVVWQWLCHILIDFHSVWHHKKIIITQQVSCQSIYSNSIWKIIKGTIDIIKSMISQEIKTSSYQHNDLLVSLQNDESMNIIIKLVSRHVAVYFWISYIISSSWPHKECKGRFRCNLCWDFINFDSQLL